MKCLETYSLKTFFPNEVTFCKENYVYECTSSDSDKMYVGMYVLN
jgi:hypothetical protein